STVGHDPLASSPRTPFPGLTTNSQFMQCAHQGDIPTRPHSCRSNGFVDPGRLPGSNPMKATSTTCRQPVKLDYFRVADYSPRNDQLRHPAQRRAAAVSRPVNAERVDFLGADVAGKHRGAVRRDVDLRTTHLHRLHHPSKVSQAGDGFNLVVSDSEALRFGFHAA